MKARKLIKWGVAGLLLTLLAAAGAVYLCASAKPSSYQPSALSEPERTEAARRFVLKIQEFGNLAQRNEAYDWTITQDEINDALASMDEIAATTAEEGKAPEVRNTMLKAGFSDPAVALNDGLLTVMINSRELGRVVSADLSFSFTPDKLMQVHLKGARVGVLPMPEETTREFLRKMQEGNRRQAASGRSGGNILTGGMSYDDLESMMSMIVGGIDKNAISTERTWPVNNKAIRVEGITVSEGKLTLHVVPVGRKKGSRD